LNIRQIFSEGQSRSTTEEIVEYIGGDHTRFAELMGVFNNGDYRLKQCSAWPISVVAEDHPELGLPYLSKLIDDLPRTDVHNAVKRSIVRALHYVEIPKSLQGKVFSHCLDLIGDPSQPVAIRAFSLTVASKIAAGEPALINELRLIVMTHLPGTSAAFRVRARGVLTEA